MARDFYSGARTAVHAAGIFVGVLIAAAAAWMIARDYRHAADNAALHLDNFAVVVAEHTALALRAARPEESAALTGTSAPGGAVDVGRTQRFFADLYGSLDLAYAGRISLLRRDGMLLMTVPPADAALGRSFSTHPVVSFATRGAQSGAIELPGIIERSQRLMAYRTVKGYPLIVVVSAPVSEVLGDWWRHGLAIALGAVLFAGLGGAAAFALGRQLRVTQRLGGQASENAMQLGQIIASAMDAIITVDEGQRVVLFNAAAERIFRCGAAEAVGSPLERFIPERYREEHAAHVKRFGESGETTRRMGGDLVLAGLRADGEEFPIDASISQATVAGRKLYTVILRDVTARVRARENQDRAEAKLRESEQRLQSIIASAMDAIITADEAQRIVLFNAAAEQIFGHSAADAIGTPLDRLIPARYREDHRRHVNRFGEAGVTTRRMGGELVLAGLRSDGREFPIDASISHTEVDGRKFYTVILRDVTERQRSSDALARSHQELRELYGTMHQVRESERTRIARELHDELAQWLTALKMDVSWMRSRLPQHETPLMNRADRMKGVVDSTIAAMRRIAADLRPLMLDDLGLSPALEHLLHELCERTGIRVAIDEMGDVAALREPLVTAVYRMVQEALTNVARHSGATEVRVELGMSEGRLRVVVRDNGRGLKLDPSHKSYGLLGIRERARTLGGEARIYSPDAGGTVVDIDVPFVRETALRAAGARE